jgi:hypothetical protein
MRIIAQPAGQPLPGDVTVADTFRSFSSRQHNLWIVALNKLLDGELAEKSIALYPASHLTFEALTESKLGNAQVLGMFDIDVKKQGSKILGLNVYPPESLKTYQPDLILVFTMAYEQEIRESFVAMGLCSRVISISELVNKGWN